MDTQTEQAIDYAEERTYTPREIERAETGRLMPPYCFRPADGLPAADLAELDRPLRVEVSPVQIKLGRLAVLNCGNGWLKIDMLCPEQDSEAELLSPKFAAELKKWINK